MIEEIWKNIEELGNNYAISNTGKIKNIKTSRVLKTVIKDGYELSCIRFI